MLYYRLYFMKPGTGHIIRFEEYEAPGDEAAIVLAEEHVGDHPLELWCQHRKVRAFEPVDPELRAAE